MAKLEDLAERVDRLVLRHQELKRTSALIERQLLAVSAEQSLRLAYGGHASLEVRERRGYYGVTVRLPLPGHARTDHESADRR